MNQANALQRAVVSSTQSPSTPERRRERSRTSVEVGLCPQCKSNDMVEGSVVGETGYFCTRCNRAF